MVDGVREGPTRSSLDLTHLCPGTESALGSCKLQMDLGEVTRLRGEGSYPFLCSPSFSSKLFLKIH